MHIYYGSICFLISVSVICSISSASPLLGSDDEQIVEQKEVDGSEPGPHVEESSSFGHFLEFALLLQVSSLGDDRDGLKRGRNIYLFF